MPAASLARRAEVRAEELEAELHAERAENADFADRVYRNGGEAWAALQVGHVETIEQRLAQIIAAASRRRRQAGGGA